MHLMTFIHKQLFKKGQIMTFIVIFLHVPFMPKTLLAQENTVQEIDQMTGYVESNITDNAYYLNEYKINSKRYSLHQPGYFQYFERYYYAQDKRPDKDRSVLLKAVVTVREKEEVVYLRKFIYDDDSNLIYYIERKSRVSTAPDNEVRIYFNQGELVKYMINDQDEIGLATVPQDHITTVVSESSRYMKKFKEQMQQIQFY